MKYEEALNNYQNLNNQVYRDLLYAILTKFPNSFTKNSWEAAQNKLTLAGRELKTFNRMVVCLQFIFFLFLTNKIISRVKLEQPPL